MSQVSQDVLERVARIAHEVNRGVCAAIGDETHVPWDVAPAWQRESVLDGVRGVLSGALVDAEAQHESWLARKTAEGWQYGDVKDVVAKRHPACVAWCELSIGERIKGYLFRTVCLEAFELLKAGDKRND